MLKVVILVFTFTTNVFAHSGRTNSQGCHNSSSGYHCHGGKVNYNETNIKNQNTIKSQVQNNNITSTTNEDLKALMKEIEKIENRLLELKRDLRNELKQHS